MKRYIRTKNWKIYDLSKYDLVTIEQNLFEKNGAYIKLHTKYANMYIEEKDIIKQADTIEELIEVGDLYSMLLLVDMGEAIIEETYEIKNESDLKDFIECVKMGNIAVNKIYTKQGNDYILCCFKNENGEWRVI